jgi:hypothetical protein
VLPVVGRLPLLVFTWAVKFTVTGSAFATAAGSSRAAASRTIELFIFKVLLPSVEVLAL